MRNSGREIIVPKPMASKADFLDSGRSIVVLKVAKSALGLIRSVK